MKVLKSFGISFAMTFTIFALGFSAEAQTSTAFTGKAYCSFGENGFDVFYFWSDGRFTTRNERLSAADAKLKLANARWTFDEQTQQITANLNAPSLIPATLTIQVISPDELQFESKSLKTQTCKAK